ncbi:DUF4145 domain-containing protein [Bosea sp. LjRoot90]|uniref:DUF4145 domain-containing protein n=1 Tax=Bosea sp. LjRoot90 TaxID=3342342 RepID=UPI003ECED9FA
MNWLDFFASIVGSIASLAWPAAVFGGVCLFRHEIRNALPKLRLKHGDTEISFRLEQAEQTALTLPEPEDLPPPPPPTPEERSRYERLAELSPTAAILEVRLAVEHAARALAASHRIEGAEKAPLMQLTRDLRGRNLIDSATSAILDDIRAIGNTAAHKPNEFDKDEALRVKRLGDQTIDVLLRMLNF